MDTFLQVAASWILPALFFWFLFSLIAMTLIEIIQRFSSSRQKGLEEIITNLVGADLKEDFYKHALANPLDNTKPSYISDVLFAKVVMDWILKKPVIQTQNKKLDKNVVYKTIQSNIESIAEKNADFGNVLHAIVVQANMKTETLPEFLGAVEKDLEAWFYEAVNQMTPVYGARLQRLTLWVSVLVSFMANFDVINITVRLWETSKYAELLNLAEKTGQTLQIDTNRITTLPVGWYSGNVPDTTTGWLLKVVGLYLGAFFIAVGSQYVFNLSKRQYRPAK